MSHLIDADALMKRQPDIHDTYDESGDYDYAHGYTINAIKTAPTVDAVPVCRCKDCQYSREPNRHDRDENAACEGVLICCVGFDHVYPSAYDGLIFVDKNGYCFHGERKGGDE